jgi:hypothetical protein
VKLPPSSLHISYMHAGKLNDTFVTSLWEFRDLDAAGRRLWDGKLRKVRGYYFEDNRNAQIREFMPTTGEALLMMDTDISQVSPDAVYALADALDPDTHPIVAGFYVSRTRHDPLGKVPDMLVPLWWDFDEQAHQYVTISRFEGDDRLQRIAACAFGFTLIHRAALERFPEREVPLNGGVRERYSVPDFVVDPSRWFGRDLGFLRKNVIRLPEDVTFCDRAGKLSIPIHGHCGTGRLLWHHKEHAENLDTFLASAGLAPPRMKPGWFLEG